MSNNNPQTDMISLTPEPVTVVADNSNQNNYCNPITWDDGFERWTLVRFNTPADGSCLFHSLLNAFSIPYHQGVVNGRAVNRKEIVRNLRRELSKTLAQPIDPQRSDGPRYYDVINKGNTALFAKDVPEFNLEYMQRELDSNNPIGYGYMEYISNVMEKDIYILDANNRDVYRTAEDNLLYQGRPSIVLYYQYGHYELVGLKNREGGYDTHFSPNHSFIRFLRARLGL